MCLKSLQLMEKGMVLHECNWKFFFLICIYVYYQSNFLYFFPQSPHYIWVFQICFTSQFPHIQFSMKNSSMSKSVICDQLSIHLWYYIYPSFFFNLLSLFPKKTYWSLNSHYNALYMWTFQPRPPWYLKINNSVIWSLGSLLQLENSKC